MGVSASRTNVTPRRQDVVKNEEGPAGLIPANSPVPVLVPGTVPGKEGLGCWSAAKNEFELAGGGPDGVLGEGGRSGSLVSGVLNACSRGRYASRAMDSRALHKSQSSTTTISRYRWLELWGFVARRFCTSQR